MADSLDKKLDMSLDDLMKKDRRQYHSSGGGGGPGPQRQHFSNNRQGQQQQHGGNMGNWPWRGGKQQQQQHQQQHRAMHTGPQQQGQGWWPQGQQQQPQQQQQQQQHEQQWAGTNAYQQQGPQRQGPYHQQKRKQSVFARLGGTPDSGGYMQPQQPQQPQQQYQHHPQRQFGGYQQQQQDWQPDRQPAQPTVVQPVKPPPKPQLTYQFDEDAGVGVVYHEDWAILQVTPAGDVFLDSGGDHSAARRQALTLALSHINMAVREIPQAAANGQQQQPPSVAAPWNVYEGNRLMRFTDGMKLPARGMSTMDRMAKLDQAFGAGTNKAAAAAQEASRKAAMEAGLLPAADAAAAGGAGAEGEDPEDAKIRRLKAQGRYMPY